MEGSEGARLEQPAARERRKTTPAELRQLLAKWYGYGWHTGNRRTPEELADHARTLARVRRVNVHPLQLAEIVSAVLEASRSWTDHRPDWTERQRKRGKARGAQQTTERRRRRLQAHVLRREGLSNRQIAGRLRVSLRTVQRDLKPGPVVLPG